MPQPALPPLQLEPVPAAPLHGHRQDDTIGTRRLDHRLAVPFVNQDAGAATGQLAARASQPRVDQPLSGFHRGPLSRIRPIVPDPEQGPAERLPVIHRKYQQGIPR